MHVVMRRHNLLRLKGVVEQLAPQDGSCPRLITFTVEGLTFMTAATKDGSFSVFLRRKVREHCLCRLSLLSRVKHCLCLPMHAVPYHASR